jgi:hypothetical protein
MPEPLVLWRNWIPVGHLAKAQNCRCKPEIPLIGTLGIYSVDVEVERI